MTQFEVTNPTENEKVVIPNLKTNFRTSFGKLVQQNKLESMVISKGTNEYSFNVVKPVTSQAYDVTLDLNADNQVVSNKVVAHYVVTGNSASIQNVVTDKDQYKKGESAVVSFSWAGSLSNFPGARKEAVKLEQANIIASISSAKQKCSEEVTNQMINGKDIALSISIPIIENCLNPVVSVTVKDPSGNVLAAENYKIDSRNAPSKIIPSSKVTVLSSIHLLLIISIIVLLVAIYIKWRKGKKGKIDSRIKSLLFFLFFCGGFMSFNSVKADTFIDITPQWHYVAYEVNLDQASYPSGATMTVSARVLVGTCSNHWDIVGLNGRINNRSKTILWGMLPGSVFFGPFTQTFRAPRAAGDYNAKFWSILASMDIGYSITAGTTPPVNGACGPLTTAGVDKTQSEIDAALKAVDTTISSTWEGNPAYDDALADCNDCLANHSSVWTVFGWVKDGRQCINPDPYFKDDNKALIGFTDGHMGRGSYWKVCSIYGCSDPFWLGSPPWYEADQWYPDYASGVCSKNCSGNGCNIEVPGDPKPSAFCESGVSPKLAAEVTNSGTTWSWVCKGYKNGIDQACSTTTAAINTCGLRHNNCVSGTLMNDGDNAPADHGGVFTWSCSKTVGTDVQISRCLEDTTKTVGCGLADNIPALASTQPSMNLCGFNYKLSGNVVQNGTTNKFEWKCVDINNATIFANCTAPIITVPTPSSLACGTYDGTDTSHMCISGTPSTLNPALTNGTWSWTCKEISGTATKNCSAQDGKWREVPV